MRMLIGFICGAAVCGLFFFGVQPAFPTQAETNGSAGESENITQTLQGLVPDIETIYQQSLKMPFKKAESKIYDKDIAEFYGELLDSTGLR